MTRTLFYGHGQWHGHGHDTKIGIITVCDIFGLSQGVLCEISKIKISKNFIKNFKKFY